MKILLIGEYSRFHGSLKEGLEKLGHQVTLVGTGDSFKKYPVDINISPKWTTNSWLSRTLQRAIYRLTKYDIALWETGYRFKKIRHNLKGYDVVQLINSWSIRTHVIKEREHITFITQNNKKIFLSACGTDTPWVESLLNNKLPYHLLSPYLNDTSKGKRYVSILKYTREPHKSLYKYIQSVVEKIIPTDLDYFLGISKNPKVTPLIATPINLSKFTYNVNPIINSIIIFHGINKSSYFKKGNHIFEEALTRIKKEYNTRIKIIRVVSLPYQEYIKSYNSAHIILDQVYSHDQGYNALEAMAQGKVVFTGAGIHFKEHYNLSETVAIDATPDVDQIVRSLKKLIENPETIEEIGRNARLFIETHHHYKKVAQTYIDTWNN